MKDQKIYVVRFSDDIEGDIERGWSAFMHPSIGGTREECERDAREFGYGNDIREFPDGGFACVHHEGLSCYSFAECNSVEEVEAQFRERKGEYDGSGWAETTVGEVVLVKTILAKDAGTLRDMHILLVDDVASEL